MEEDKNMELNKEYHHKTMDDMNREREEKFKQAKFLNFLRVDIHESKLGNKFPRIIMQDTEGNYYFCPIKLEQLDLIRKSFKRSGYELE